MKGELSEKEMNAILESEIFGHLGCADEHGKPYVTPMAFVFHDNVLYGQTTEGKKVEILRKNPQVCFQVEVLKERQWSSIVCWGIFEELDFDDLQGHDVEAVKMLTERIGRIQDNVGIDVPFSFSERATPLKVNEKKSTLFRIVLTEKTGKFYRKTEEIT